MSTKITDELLQEATKLLEQWAKNKNLLTNDKRLVVTMSFEDSASVSLKMENKTYSEKVDEILAQPRKKLKLSTRADRCLNNRSYYIIGDFVRKPEKDFLRLRNFGRKSLEELQNKLRDLGLFIDMDIPVGPREREAVLRGPFDGYVHFFACQKLEAAGIMNVKDLLSKTQDEIVAILNDCDPKEIGSPQHVYEDMLESLRQRQLI